MPRGNVNVTSRSAVFLLLILLAATARAHLPIGVFDSGTGGLAVLEEIVKLDRFDNPSGKPVLQGDGTPDFCHERFIFLADQANMPYGNYCALGKTPFLRELIRNDGLFLLGTEFYSSAEARLPRTGKLPIKAMVVACNTADAFGKADLESLVATTGANIPVIGMIDAAAREAVEVLKRHGGGTIGVLATDGTVAADAYPTAIRRLAVKLAFRGPIGVVQQGSLGLAGAIDGAREFIVPLRETNAPRADYRGPSFSNTQARIDPRLLPRYQFDFAQQRMLWAGDQGNPEVLQINSVENYIRYDVVTLLESVGRGPKAGPLRAIILGCTHFPHYSGAIAAELRRLFDYREQGQYIYRESMAADVIIIDPATAVGEELYSVLASARKLAGGMTLPPGETRGEFYMTVPYRGDPSVVLDPHGWFTYEYKYGRNAGRVGRDVRTVPLLPGYLDSPTVERLSRTIPGVWGLLEDFLSHNAKLSAPKADRGAPLPATN